MISNAPTRPEAESPFFRAWARVVLRLRWPILLACAAISAILLHQATTALLVDNSNEAFMEAGSEADLRLTRLRDAFGRDELFLVLAEGDVFSIDYLKRLRALHDDLASIDLPLESLGERKADRDQKRLRARGGTAHAAAASLSEGDADFEGFVDDDEEGWGNEAGGSVIEQVLSLVNARRTRSVDGALRVDKLLDELPAPDSLPALERDVLSDPTLVGQLVGKAGHHSVLAVRTGFMSEEDSARVNAELERVLAEHEAPGFALGVSGMPAILVALNTAMTEDMSNGMALTVLMLLVVMVVLFRHWLGVAGPILVVVQAALWTLGTIAVTQTPMTLVTSVLGVFLMVVGIGDSVHLLSIYRDARARGVGNDDAVVHAVATTGSPVFFTSLTTAAGLVSFRFAHMEPIRDMGTFGGIGVLYAFLLSLTFLPALLSFNRKSLFGLEPVATLEALKAAAEGAKAPATSRIDRVLTFCNGLSSTSTGRRRTLVAGAVLALVAGYGATQLRFHHDPITWFPDGSPAKQTVVDLSTHVGGTADVSLLIEANPGKDLRDRELMLALERVEQDALAYRDPHTGAAIVKNATSLLDVVRESWRALHGGEGRDSEHYRVPPSQRGVVDVMTLFEGASPDELKRLATIDWQQSLMTLRVTWLAAQEYVPLTHHLQQSIDAIVGDRARVALTGTVYNSTRVVAQLLQDLANSFAAALLAITIMMVLLLRDLKLGLISMLPNLLPIAALVALTSFTGIPIDVNNLMVGSIAIGIAVDDTIHFLYQFRAHYRARGDVDESIELAFRHAGRAMVSTSLILVAGFLVMLTGSMSSSKIFGVLVACAVVFALAADLAIAPAVLRTFYRNRAAAAG